MGSTLNMQHYKTRAHIRAKQIFQLTLMVVVLAAVSRTLCRWRYRACFLFFFFTVARIDFLSSWEHVGGSRKFIKLSRAINFRGRAGVLYYFSGFLIVRDVCP